MLAKPFLKWAGGKGQLIDQIKERYPVELGGTITKYVEPFVGSGAVLFDILNSHDLTDVFIGDANIELINVYRAIKYYVEELIGELSCFENEYLPLNELKRKDYYYEKRKTFNDLSLGEEINIEKAALFIYLNKTCFNGLYRVNRKGLFNVPIGSYKKPKICDSSNLISVNKKLQKVVIYHGDYIESLNYIDKNTFVYLDPPYRPISKASSFTSYTSQSFTDQDQMSLAKYFQKIDSIGAYGLLSNSDPKNSDKEDEFFDDLYKKFKIDRVNAKRSINAKGNGRGIIKELLISNY